MRDWPTKEKDLQTANNLIDNYAKLKNVPVVGLVEVIFDEKERQINFQLSKWVVHLARYFHEIYGEKDGDKVIRNVISSYIVNGELMH